jgi:site-specific DNA recombinase
LPARSYSLDAQTKRLDAYIASQPDWQHVATFSDRVSGATLDRPELTNALTQARAGRYDLLLVYRVDRLARSIRGLAQILEDLDTAGVAFRSATEPFDTATPAGRMMVQMLGVFAEFERATIIDRVIAGMERKAAKGGWSGRVPYGYRLDRDRGTLTIHDDEAAIVRRIFNHYTHDRIGARAIAMRLTADGHRTAARRAWSHRSVLTVLGNRAYLGQTSFRDTTTPDTHPAVIDREIFEHTQSILAQRARTHAKRAANGSDYLLAGLLTCTSCHTRFIGNAAHGRTRRYRYYTCHTRHRYGPTACNADRLPADDLDHAIVTALINTYADTDLVTNAIARSQQRNHTLRAQHQAEHRAVTAEIATAEQAIDRLLGAFETGAIPETICGDRIRPVTAKLGDLHNRRDELAELLDAADTPLPTNKQIANAHAHLQHALTNGGDQQRKALLQLLIANVQVAGRDHIKPVFRVPLNYPQNGTVISTV